MKNELYRRTENKKQTNETFVFLFGYRQKKKTKITNKNVLKSLDIYIQTYFSNKRLLVGWLPFINIH